MSIFQFLASDRSLKEVENLYKGYLHDIEIKNSGYLYCGYEKDYSNKRYFSNLDWRYTETRAKELIDYLKGQLEILDEIEIWSIWVDDNEAASINSVNINELSIQDLEFLDSANGFDKPKCLIVKR